MLTQRLGSKTQKNPEFTDALIEEIKNNPGSCDEVWLATDYGFPPLTKHAKAAGTLKEVAGKFRCAGIRVSLQLSNSIGHGQYMRSEDCTGLVYDGSPVEKMVGPDGTVAGYCFCWNGENFRKYTTEALRLYLRAVKPHTLWVDDDLRATNHNPVQFGCFCDGCIEKFNKKYGTDFNREGLVKAVNDDTEIRQKHIEFLRDTLADFTSELGKVVSEEAPGCRMGLQGCANGGYTGFGYKHIFDAMKNSTGLAPASRPGGGAYSDYSPRNFINKAMYLAYQNLMLPAYVTEKRPEIESLPDVVYGKSIAGTCFETTVYLACGNTAMSYAILMNDYEPMSWHGEMLNAFSAQRTYWEKLSDVSKSGTLSGLTPYFPRSGYLAKSEKPFDYSREDIFFAEDLAYLAVPVAFTNKESKVYVINGSTAERLSGKEIEFLLSKSVICDGEAVHILHERGYINNADSRKTDVGQLYEEFTNHTVNSGFEGRVWRGQIWRDFDYEILGNELEILSNYCTVSSGEKRELGIASAVFKTSKNAKWAVFGFDFFSRTKSFEKRTQLLNTCKYLCGEGFAAKLESRLQAVILPVINDENECIAVSIINTTVGESGKLRLIIRKPCGSTFSFMSMTLPETKIAAKPLGNDEFELEIPSVSGWSVGTVFIK